jgi:hypothetical protein
MDGPIVFTYNNYYPAASTSWHYPSTEEEEDVILILTPRRLRRLSSHYVQTVSLVGKHNNDSDCE